MCTEEEKRILANPCDNTPERMAILAKHIGEEFLFKQTVSDPDYYPDREFEINYDGIPGLESRGVIREIVPCYIILDCCDDKGEKFVADMPWQMFHDMITYPVENGKVSDMPKEMAQ